MDKRYKDSKIKILEGRRAHKPLKENMRAIPLSSVPKCPTEIKGRARQFWKQNAPILIKHNLLQNIDLSAFEVMAITWGDFWDITEKLKNEELPKANRAKLQTQLKRTQKELTAWFKEFGMLPPCRENLDVYYGEKQAKNWP